MRGTRWPLGEHRLVHPRYADALPVDQTKSAEQVGQRRVTRVPSRQDVVSAHTACEAAGAGYLQLGICVHPAHGGRLRLHPVAVRQVVEDGLADSTHRQLSLPGLNEAAAGRPDCDVGGQTVLYRCQRLEQAGARLVFEGANHVPPGDVQTAQHELRSSRGAEQQDACLRHATIGTQNSQMGE